MGPMVRTATAQSQAMAAKLKHKASSLRTCGGPRPPALPVALVPLASLSEKGGSQTGWALASSRMQKVAFTGLLLVLEATATNSDRATQSERNSSKSGSLAVSRKVGARDVMSARTRSNRRLAILR